MEGIPTKGNKMARKKAVLRTRKGRITFPILGGKATAEQLDRVTIKKIVEKHKIINKDGSIGHDNESAGIEMFRLSLVGIEGFYDEDGNELVLNEKFKDDIINLEPDFFIEFSEKSKEAFGNREDVATKNS